MRGGCQRDSLRGFFFAVTARRYRCEPRWKAAAAETAEAADEQLRVLRRPHEPAVVVALVFV